MANKMFDIFIVSELVPDNLNVPLQFATCSALAQWVRLSTWPCQTELTSFTCPKKAKRGLQCTRETRTRQTLTPVWHTCIISFYNIIYIILQLQYLLLVNFLSMILVGNNMDQKTII